MPPLPSNLRVFVKFKEDTVFAGEDVEATITFRNVEPSRPPQEKTKQRAAASVPPIHESPASTQFPPSQPASRTAHSRHTSITSQGGAPLLRSPQARRASQLGHRQTLSLNQLESNSRKVQPSLPQTAGTAPGTPRPGSHGRSVSIVSIGGDAEPKSRRSSAYYRDPARPGPKLSRSASVQVTPTTGASSRWGYSTNSGGSKPLPSPLATATSVPDGFPWGRPARGQIPAHARHASASNGAIITPRDPHTRAASGRIQPESKLPPSSFKFPPSPSASPAPPPGTSVTPRMDSVPFSEASTSAVTPAKSDIPPSSSKASAMTPAVARLISPERKPPLNRVFSLSSEAGTPRSSTEIYSSSNHSDETMASEIPSAAGLLRRPPFFRNSSSRPYIQRYHGPETLMMGFANVVGSFSLDGSLVNQAPFEDVKRRAVVGGQGAGGVVGVDQRKGQGGIFGGLSWSGIGESLSLGGILGGDQQSSIREMKNTAESESVPLLSTPKSILFVDLRLAPGESRSYSYCFTLPRGLPPSHRGRAMKVTYQLVIGTQRPGAGGKQREQYMREVKIPFRVFGGVDAHGEILGHDLMSPYIILRDQARSSQLDLDGNGKPTKASSKASASEQASKSSEADFNAYVTKLLSSPRRNSSTGLISPTAESFADSPISIQARRQSGVALPPPPSTRVLVDSAIRLSTQPLPQRQDTASTTSQTNFTIARAGQPLATLTLSRPALRLGDLLHITMDFSPRLSGSRPVRATTDKTLVHAISLTLESMECIDPSLAVRSAASIDRATRRIWDRRVVGGAAGAALGWCKRWSGGLKVPSNATPTFGTTGVECRWVVRVEIAVGVSQTRKQSSHGESTDPDSEEENDHQGEGAARRQEARRQIEQGQVEAPSPDTTPSQSPVPSRANSLRRKPTLSRQTTLTRKKSQRQKERDEAQDEQEQAFVRSRQLLERVVDDERGVTLAAVRRVPGDVFEIAVPIRVFGGIGIGGGEALDAALEGLAV